MKKILVLVMVLLLSGCTTPVDEWTESQLEVYCSVVGNWRSDHCAEIRNEYEEEFGIEKDKLDLILDRLDTIDMNINDIETDLDQLQREFHNVSRSTNDDCILEMLEELLEGLDSLEHWSYDDYEQGIYYKNKEDSEIQFITIYKILEDIYCS